MSTSAGIHATKVVTQYVFDNRLFEVEFEPRKIGSIYLSPRDIAWAQGAQMIVLSQQILSGRHRQHGFRLHAGAPLPTKVGDEDVAAVSRELGPASGDVRLGPPLAWHTRSAWFQIEDMLDHTGTVAVTALSLQYGLDDRVFEIEFDPQLLGSIHFSRTDMAWLQGAQMIASGQKLAGDPHRQHGYHFDARAPLPARIGDRAVGAVSRELETGRGTAADIAVEPSAVGESLWWHGTECPWFHPEGDRPPRSADDIAFGEIEHGRESVVAF